MRRTLRGAYAAGSLSIPGVERWCRLEPWNLGTSGPRDLGADPSNPTTMSVRSMVFLAWVRPRYLSAWRGDDGPAAFAGGPDGRRFSSTPVPGSRRLRRLRTYGSGSPGAG